MAERYFIAQIEELVGDRSFSAHALFSVDSNVSPEEQTDEIARKWYSETEEQALVKNNTLGEWYCGIDTLVRGREFKEVSEAEFIVLKKYI